MNSESGRLAPIGPYAFESLIAPERQTPLQESRAAVAHGPLLPNGICVLHGIFLLGIVLSMTTVTHSLDDIKKLFFFIMGPVLMFLALLTYALGLAPAPPRLVCWGLIGFLATVLISALFSEYRWIGRSEGLMWYCGAGFMLAGAVIGSRRKTSESFIRLLVIQLLITNLIGVFLFDFSPNNPDFHSMVHWLFNQLYANGQVDLNQPIQSLLYTFSVSDGAMQSTILNRDFYSAFCILYLPFAILMALDPGPSRSPWAWRVIGAITTFLTIICILATKMPKEYIIGILVLIAFFSIYSKIQKTLHSRATGSTTLATCILIVAILFACLITPTKYIGWKSLKASLLSHEIIWNGALHVFKDHPILGGGPGTFRIYFPEYQAPDYYEHEIANVTPEAHNYFLDLLSEMGLVGCGFYVLLALSAIGMAAKFIFRSNLDPRMRVLLLAALCGLLGMYASNMASPNARWVIGAVSLWTVLGLTVGLVVQARTTKHPNAATDENEFTPAESVTNEVMAKQTEEYLRRRQRFLLFSPALALALVMPLYGSDEGWHYFRSQHYHLTALRQMNIAQDQLERREKGVSGPSDDMLLPYLEDAIDKFNISLDWDRTNFTSYYQLGSVFTTLANFEDAKLRELYEKKADCDTLAMQAEKMNRYLRQAKDTYEVLAKIWPDYAEIHYNFGLIYHRIATITRVQMSLGLNQGLAPFPERTPEEWDELALEHCKMMRERSIKDQVAILLADQYLYMNRLPEAVKAFEDAARRYPRNEALLREYHDTAHEAGDVAAQRDALEKLHALRPTDDGVSIMLRDLKKH